MTTRRRRPARTKSAARATDFIATVLPPALGPEITSTLQDRTRSNVNLGAHFVGNGLQLPDFGNPRLVRQLLFQPVVLRRVASLAPCVERRDALIEPGRAYAVYAHVPLPKKPEQLKSLLRTSAPCTITLDLPEADDVVLSSLPASRLAGLGVVKSNQVIMDFDKLTIWDSLLLAVTDRHAIDEGLRPAFDRALLTIGSDYERERVQASVEAGS